MADCRQLELFSSLSQQEMSRHTCCPPTEDSYTCPPTEVLYSHFRNFAPPLDEKGGIITEKVFPVFSERVFRACFGLVI